MFREKEEKWYVCISNIMALPSASSMMHGGAANARE